MVLNPGSSSSCAGGSSISGNGFSRNSASSPPSRHSAACCARWAIASFRLAPAITPRPRAQSIFRRVGLRLLELKLQLVEQPRRALEQGHDPAAATFDLKIEMRDQRATLRQFRDGRHGARLLRAPVRSRAAISAAFSASRSSGSGERSGQRHGKIKIAKIGRLRRPFCVYSANFLLSDRQWNAMSLAACADRCPTATSESWAVEIVTVPSANDGHRNRPRSNRFENRHKPWPSLQPNQRPRGGREKRTRWPESGSRLNVSRTISARPSKSCAPVGVWFRPLAGAHRAPHSRSKSSPPERLDDPGQRRRIESAPTRIR